MELRHTVPKVHHPAALHIFLLSAPHCTSLLPLNRGCLRSLNSYLGRVTEMAPQNAVHCGLVSLPRHVFQIPQAVAWVSAVLCYGSILLRRVAGARSAYPLVGKWVFGFFQPLAMVNSPAMDI